MNHLVGSVTCRSSRLDEQSHEKPECLLPTGSSKTLLKSFQCILVVPLVHPRFGLQAVLPLLWHTGQIQERLCKGEADLTADIAKGRGQSRSRLHNNDVKLAPGMYPACFTFRPTYNLAFCSIKSDSCGFQETPVNPLVLGVGQCCDDLHNGCGGSYGKSLEEVRREDASAMRWDGIEESILLEDRQPRWIADLRKEIPPCPLVFQQWQNLTGKGHYAGPSLQQLVQLVQAIEELKSHMALPPLAHRMTVASRHDGQPEPNRGAP